MDYEEMSKRCGECEQTKLALEEDSAEFRIWYQGHQDVCSATHAGSSGAMQVNAAVKLWERSESIGFRYTTLLSDGDSKSFLQLKETNVYGNQNPQHKKCPSGIDSWCFYQSSLARGKKPGFHKDWVKTPINEEYLPRMPIYQRLASSELLSRTPWGGQIPPISLPSTNLPRGLAARRLFRIPPCREATIEF
ncbi:uncharacterized protein TNCV_4999221 [Trichonephila clavipes]|nr:uncharacterized protein TNCV_4999221 [Trichonephila clavipes]